MDAAATKTEKKDDEQKAWVPGQDGEPEVVGGPGKGTTAPKAAPPAPEPEPEPEASGVRTYAVFAERDLRGIVEEAIEGTDVAVDTALLTELAGLMVLVPVLDAPARDPQQAFDVASDELPEGDHELVAVTTRYVQRAGVSITVKKSADVKPR